MLNSVGVSLQSFTANNEIFLRCWNDSSSLETGHFLSVFNHRLLFFFSFLFWLLFLNENIFNHGPLKENSCRDHKLSLTRWDFSVVFYCDLKWSIFIHKHTHSEGKDNSLLLCYTFTKGRFAGQMWTTPLDLRATYLDLYLLFCSSAVKFFTSWSIGCRSTFHILLSTLNRNLMTQHGITQRGRMPTQFSRTTTTARTNTTAGLTVCLRTLPAKTNHGF